MFSSISAEVTFPSSITAPGYVTDNPGPTAATASAKAGGGATSSGTTSETAVAVSAGGRSGGSRRSMGWVLALSGIFVGVGVGAVAL